jgi:hypothetical protein
MGFMFGLMFGAMDVEGDNIHTHKRFKQNLLYSIPIGMLIGAVIGFANEFIRTGTRQRGYERLPETNEVVQQI